MDVAATLEEWESTFDRVHELAGSCGPDGLEALDDTDLMAFARRLEAARSRLALLDHLVVGALDARRTAESVGQPSTRALLSWLLRLSPVEAARRVRAAEQLAPRQAVTGEVLRPLRPALAAAQAAGEASPEQVDICLRALGQVDHRGFDPDEVSRAEDLLAQFAVTFPPQELRQLAAQVVDRVDPDGSVPDDTVQQDRRHLAFCRARDGMWTVEGRLTPALGAKLRTVLTPLSPPRPEQLPLDGGREVVEPDGRHHGQRTHDALEEVCDRLLRSGTLPDTGGVPTTLVVTIPERDLVAQRRWGMTTDGGALPAETVRRLADAAEVCPVVVDPRGVVLRMGRARRLATPSQTLALAARDGGCSFPSCTRPPEWCERHHVVAWFDGGATDLDNLTLLCSFHHHRFAARGWTCRMVDGLPTWTPPAWIDPQRRPLRHTRITATETAARLFATTIRGNAPPRRARAEVLRC